MKINKFHEETESWLSITTDGLMGYCGDKQKPISMNINEWHFQNNVRPILKKQLGVNIFRTLNFRAFFKNLYLI